MLLPRGSPEIGGLALDARYAPAQRVGGDFYDFFPLSATKLGIVVADVSGKGMPAALLMAICRTNLQHIAPRHPTPSQALIALNAALAADIQPGLFVTMLYAIVEVATNRLTLARAGHELPLILRSVAAPGEPPAEFLASEGMALGLVPTEIFSGEIVDVAVPFGPGDVLVLYTDGVTEAANEEGKEFSGARLADAGRALKAGSPGEINDGILASLRRFTGELPPRDDLTLLTVKRT